jgi:hypothetical protein
MARSRLFKWLAQSASSQALFYSPRPRLALPRDCCAKSMLRQTPPSPFTVIPNHPLHYMSRTTAAAAGLPPRLPLSTPSKLLRWLNKYSNRYHFVPRGLVYETELVQTCYKAQITKYPHSSYGGQIIPKLPTATYVVFAKSSTILHATEFIDVNTDTFLRLASGRELSAAITGTIALQGSIAMSLERQPICVSGPLSRQIAQFQRVSKLSLLRLSLETRVIRLSTS